MIGLSITFSYISMLFYISGIICLYGKREYFFRFARPGCLIIFICSVSFFLFPLFLSVFPCLSCFRRFLYIFLCLLSLAPQRFSRSCRIFLKKGLDNTVAVCYHQGVNKKQGQTNGPSNIIILLQYARKREEQKHESSC